MFSSKESHSGQVEASLPVCDHPDEGSFHRGPLVRLKPFQSSTLFQGTQDGWVSQEVGHTDPIERQARKEAEKKRKEAIKAAKRLGPWSSEAPRLRVTRVDSF